ncbi:hypothetical protein AGMMS50284_3750 [Clostridia bacterium]|nr:hypothetical protein AGMMS50284_3750 [Clostridia bacterium]
MSEGQVIDMGVWEYVLGAVLIVFSLVIIAVIILQEGHQQGLGVITGGADTFFSKNKARSWDSFLSRWTKVVAGVFVLAVIALNAIAYFGK